MNDLKENVKKYFDDTSDEYAEAYTKEETDSLRAYIFSSRRKYVLEMFDLKGGKVLDIGCGPGVLTGEFLKRGCQVWNIDISEAMVKKAKERFKPERDSDKAYFEVGDIEKLKFPDGFFDGIVCAGVLEYLLSDSLALKEIYRTLKPGGEVIFTVPNLSSPFVWLEKSVVSIVRLFRRIFQVYSESLLFREDIIDRYYCPPRFKMMLRKNGFKIDKTRFHAYRLAFLSLISSKLSLSFANNLEFLTNTWFCWAGVSYIIKAHKE